MEEIASKIREWGRDDDAPPFGDIQEQIMFLEQRLFHEYEPTKSLPHQDFLYRMRDWLFSAPDEDDQKILFQMLPLLFFVGSKEFDSLYQAAFNGPIAWWLIDELGLMLDVEGVQERLRKAVRETWFCAITDSMQIARFYHINNIEGVELRPDWRSLRILGDEKKIEKYMKGCKPPLRRIVLLEDFVGSGNQMSKAVKFASNLPKGYQTLFCPLMVCPKGAQMGKKLEEGTLNLKFHPVLELPQAIFLNKEASPNEPPLFADLRRVVLGLHHLVKGSATEDPGPFGFKDTGGLVVPYTNCPNNTLPIIYHKSDGPWNALFPRSTRV